MDLNKSQYKWLVAWGVKELAPGTAHVAKKGKDFQCEARSFGTFLYRIATEMGLKATVVVFEDVHPQRVVFAFYQADSFMRPNLPAYPVVKRMKDEAGRS